MRVTHPIIPFLNITQAVSHAKNNSRLYDDYIRSYQVSALWGILSEEAEPRRSLSQKTLEVVRNPYIVIRAL